jgi:hypothetical protein
MTGASRKPITSGKKRAAFVAPQPIQLTDRQWAQIAQYSGLPDEARREIEKVVNHYRISQARRDAQTTPAELRTELGRLRKVSDALQAGLAEGFRSPDFYTAMVYPRRPPSGWTPGTGPVVDEVALQRVYSTWSALQRLSDWLVLAQARVPNRKKGATRQSEPAYIAAEFLDGLLEKYTGRNLTRSKKRDETSEYVRAVLRIADPNLGHGTIAEAIKK